MTNIKSPLPKYKNIGELIIHEILSNQHQIGKSLATEKLLCEQYQVSRHTIREALRYVEQVGLIERRQGSGSIVLTNTMPITIKQNIKNVNDILQHGNNTIFNVLHSEYVKVSGELASLLNTENDTDCMYLSGVRIEPRDKKPVCFTKIYQLPVKESNKTNDAIDNKSNSLSIRKVIKILDTKNIGKVEQTISACLIPNELTVVLHAKKNTAALKIIRRYFSKNKKDLILIAESIYAENRFSYSSELYPE
jgi:DNA-binding GntR family transcriptional regulator